MKYERPAARSIQVVVPIPTASFSSSHREQNAPFSAFQKQRGQDISPVPLCFFSLFLFNQKKRETETKQKSLFSSFLIFKRKKNRPWRAVRKEGKSGKSERRKRNRKLMTITEQRRKGQTKRKAESLPGKKKENIRISRENQPRPK